MKKLLIILIVLLAIPIAAAIQECSPYITPLDIVNGTCQITSVWQYPSPCSQWVAVVFNENWTNIQNFTYDTGGNGLCYTIWNITDIGSYNYQIYNSTTFLGDTGNITIAGDRQMMNFTVIIFLILLNVGIFIFPLFIRRFTDSKAVDYIMRHLIFMAGILFLWLNVTILNQMAHDANLGLDTQLSFFWWFMTLLVVIVIFAMVYTTTVGAIKMLKEAEMSRRMGEGFE